jgi:hypothetical protein
MTAGAFHDSRPVVMLAQAGSPSRAEESQTVGIFQAAVTSHAGNEVDTVLGNRRTEDIYPIAGCPSTVVTGAAGTSDVGIVQVGSVEAGFPSKSLSHRHVVVVVPEAGVALGTLSLVVGGIRVELIRRGAAHPEGDEQGGHHPDRAGAGRRGAK